MASHTPPCDIIYRIWEHTICKTGTPIPITGRDVRTSYMYDQQNPFVLTLPDTHCISSPTYNKASATTTPILTLSTRLPTHHFTAVLPCFFFSRPPTSLTPSPASLELPNKNFFSPLHELKIAPLFGRPAGSLRFYSFLSRKSRLSCPVYNHWYIYRHIWFCIISLLPD